MKKILSVKSLLCVLFVVQLSLRKSRVLWGPSLSSLVSLELESKEEKQRDICVQVSSTEKNREGEGG